MVRFNCVTLIGTNKVGKLTPDAEGYYEVVLGGFETSNVHGDVYNFTDKTRSLFETSSTFMRNIRGGHLFGEYGHPTRMPNESVMAFLKRCIVVSEDRQAFHIRNVKLDDKSVKDAKGNVIVAVIGEIKPMGPRGPALKEILNTPSANACFSVRAMTDDTIVGGREIRAVREIITWDYVIDPGVPTSTKYHSPKLESVMSLDITQDIIIKLRDDYRMSGLTMESSNAVRILDEIIRDNVPRQILEPYTPRSRAW